MLALPASLYDAYLQERFDAARRAEDQRREDEARAEREQLLADMKNRIGR